MPNTVTVSGLADASMDPSCRLNALWGDGSAIEPAPEATAPREEIHALLLRTATWSRPSASEPWHIYVTTGALTSDADIIFLPAAVVVAPDVYTTRRLELRFADRFEQLRSRLRLPVRKYALLLGTTRRTLYHWLETDRPQELAIGRLDRLGEWTTELERHLPKYEVQQLMDPDSPRSIGALLVEAGEEAAAARLEALTSSSAGPRAARRLAELANNVDDSDVPVLTGEQAAAALIAFGSPRRVISPPPDWRPSELTDSVPDDPA